MAWLESNVGLRHMHIFVRTNDRTHMYNVGHTPTALQMRVPFCTQRTVSWMITSAMGTETVAMVNNSSSAVSSKILPTFRSDARRSHPANRSNGTLYIQVSCVYISKFRRH